MFQHLVAVVSPDTPKPEVAQAPAQPSQPVQAPTGPAGPVESDAHKRWVQAKTQFQNQFSQGQEATGNLREIMIATIGEEPPFA